MPKHALWGHSDLSTLKFFGFSFSVQGPISNKLRPWPWADLPRVPGYKNSSFRLTLWVKHVQHNQQKANINWSLDIPIHHDNQQHKRSGTFRSSNQKYSCIHLLSVNTFSGQKVLQLPQQRTGNRRWMAFTHYRLKRVDFYRTLKLFPFKCSAGREKRTEKQLKCRKDTVQTSKA